MTLTYASPTGTFYPTFLNQILNVLQRVSGQQDVNHYLIAGNNYQVASLFQTDNIVFRSRNVTPVSISLDQSDQSAASLNSPAVGHISMGAAQVFASASAVGTDANVGGKATIQY